jgi:DNA-binding response OmpR family regulator
MNSASRDILLIDDSPEVLLVHGKILSGAGFKVHSADSVESGLKILSAEKLTLILLDLNLPGASGFEFLKMRSLSASLKKTPVIVVSGLTDKASVYQAISLGAEDYLVKPCAAPLLLQKVRKQLKDVNYQKHVFNAEKLIPGNIAVPVKITKVGETSFRVESLSRLGPNQAIHFKPDFLEKLQMQGCVIRSSTLPASKTPNGFYVCRVNVLGLKNSLIKNLMGVK